MSPLASHALLWGVLFAGGWAVYVVCLMAERRTAYRCMGRCCLSGRDKSPAAFEGHRALSSTPREGEGL